MGVLLRSSSNDKGPGRVGMAQLEKSWSNFYTKTALKKLLAQLIMVWSI